MRVLFCGDRNWTDVSKIKEFIDALEPGDIVIEGEAKGADSIARDLAEQAGLEVLKFPAEWGNYGRAAGPIRNRQMLDEGKPELVYAFHSNIATSKGTRNMILQAQARGIPTMVITGN